MATLNRITLNGFKSLRALDAFRFRNLNLLIGANGAGKSNLVAFFRLVNEIVERRLQHFILKQGGAETFLFNGVRYRNRAVDDEEAGVDVLIENCASQPCRILTCSQAIRD